MGGRGAKSGGGGAGGGLGSATIPQAGATIPTPPGAGAGALTGAGSGVSDVNSHTTYFTPADTAIVNGSNTLGMRYSVRNGQMNNVGYYNTGDYYNINTDLRNAQGDVTKLNPTTRTVVDAMDRNMRPLNKPMDTVRWTSTEALAGNLGMPGASTQRIINALRGGDISQIKDDYTSSSWDTSKNTVNGAGGRFIKLDMHYAKGAMGQFSPTGKEGEFVGARGTRQRFSNARMENVNMYNARTGRSGNVNCLVVDCYVD